MHRASLLILAALLLSGCPYYTDPPQIDLQQSPALDPETACPSWRWIAVKSAEEPSCPAVGADDWTVQPLFAVDPGFYDREEPKSDPQPRQGQLTDVPPGLSSFCLYSKATRGSQDASRQVFQQLIEARRLENAAPDCAAVGMAAEPATTLEASFVTQAGGGGTAVPLAGGRFQQTVRLAVVDSQPTAGGPSTVAGRSQHGYALSHFARRLACPSGSCLPQITTQLALPIVGFDPEDPTKTVRDEVNGGYFGTYGDLALAIRREVVAWQASGEKRLVLNLSLGWDGELFKDTSSIDDQPEQDRKKTASTRGLWWKPRPAPDHTAPSLSVLRALQDAACRGALIVAAAGNRTGGPQPGSGPLLPAAWEEMDSPDAATCAELLGSEKLVRDAAANPQPLLYAAGGVRSEGFKLANARPKAEPPRVAYGDHAIVTDAGGQTTASYTGSSVATAVIATTAAHRLAPQPVAPPCPPDAPAAPGGQRPRAQGRLRSHQRR